MTKVSFALITGRSAAKVADCLTDQMPIGKAGFVSHSAQCGFGLVANFICLCIL